MRRRNVGSENTVERSQRFSSSTDIVAILALNSSRIARTISTASNVFVEALLISESFYARDVGRPMPSSQHFRKRLSSASESATMHAELFDEIHFVVQRLKSTKISSGDIFKARHVRRRLQTPVFRAPSSMSAT